MGRRARYRLVETDALSQHVGGMAAELFREFYAAGIDQAIAERKTARESAWTGGLAVGSRLFVERVVREAGRT